MIKRKKSLVPKLVAGVLLCTAFTSVSPLEAHASFLSELSAEEKQQMIEERDRADAITEKANAQVYQGEDGLLHRKSDGSVIRGDVGRVNAHSAEDNYRSDTINSIFRGDFINDKTGILRRECEDLGLDYDALVKQYYASQVKGDYPTLQKGWSKNAAGQWFYSEDGVTWFTGWLHSADGNWYYLFPKTGLMATNWDVQSTTGNCHLNEAGICDKAPW